jgi:hypothetical protein
MHRENMLKMHATQTESSADGTALLESEDDAVHSSDSLSSSTPPSSRLLSTTDALELAMYTFGDLSTAQAWMQAPQGHLCGSPDQACRHPGGLDSVLQLLYAIAGGTEP